MNRFIKVLVPVLVLLAVPSASFAALDANLKYGSSGVAVTELQEFLKDQQVYTGPVTGNFYSLTLSAVKAFQKKEGIFPISGFWGPLSRTKAVSILDLSQSNNDEIKQTGTIQTQVAQTDLNTVNMKVVQDSTPPPPVSLKDIKLAVYPNSDNTDMIIDAVIYDDSGKSIMTDMYIHPGVEYACKCGQQINARSAGFPQEKFINGEYHFYGNTPGYRGTFTGHSATVEVPSLNLLKTVQFPQSDN